MRVSRACLENHLGINKNSANIAFTSDMLSLDLGASNPRGNARVNYLDKKGNVLFSYKGVLNYNAEKFLSKKDFVQKLAQFLTPEEAMTRELESINRKLGDEFISESLKNKLESDALALRENLEILAKRTGKQRKIAGITMFLPATVQKKSVQIMPNLKDINENSLENVGLKTTVKQMKQAGMQFEKSFDINTKFMPLKDLAASGAVIASKMANDPNIKKEFSKGFCASVIHCGGGFGAANLTVLDNDLVEIRTSECGHDPAIDFFTGKETRLGAVGASTPKVIDNYSKCIGITDAAELKALKETGFAQLATQTTINLSTIEHKEALEALLKTNVYEIGAKGSEITTLKVKDMARFENASRLAITAFADNIAQYSISRINRGFNYLVVSGPLAMGLDEKIKGNPISVVTKNSKGEEIEKIANNMIEAIEHRIEYRGAVDKTITGYKRAKRFKIICNPAMSVKDNNEAGAIFLSGETNSLVRRGEVVTFPKKVLEDISVYTDPSIVRKYFKNPLRKVLERAIKYLR